MLGTRVQVITVNIGAAVAAADAAEGGDGISIAVTVAEKKKQGQRATSVIACYVDLMEKLFVYRCCCHFPLPVRVSVAYRVVSRVLLLVPCYIEAHFLPVAFPLLPLALGRYVTLRGVRLC